MKFLENDLVVEKDLKRVSLAFLAKAKPQFDNILGEYNIDDLICSDYEKSVFKHITENGFSSQEDVAEYVDKKKRIDDILDWKRDFESELSNQQYALNKKELNEGSFNFVNSVNIKGQLEKYKDELFKPVSGWGRFFERFTGSAFDNLPPDVKKHFKDEKGNPLTESQVEDKINNLSLEINNYVEKSHTIDEETLYNEKIQHLEVVFRKAGSVFRNDLDLVRHEDTFLKGHEQLHSDIQERMTSLEKQIAEKDSQIEKIGLSEELKDRIEKEIDFAIMAEDKAYGVLGDKFTVRSTFSEIYASTNEANNFEMPDFKEEENKQEVQQQKKKTQKPT